MALVSFFFSFVFMVYSFFIYHKHHNAQQKKSRFCDNFASVISPPRGDTFSIRIAGASDGETQSSLGGSGEAHPLILYRMVSDREKAGQAGWHHPRAAEFVLARSAPLVSGKVFLLQLERETTSSAGVACSLCSWICS